MNSSVTIIVACDLRGVIGKEGKLPWRLPEDLRMFRERTLGHAIIMGKKTWNSLPKKPLDGRANIVMSREMWEAPSDAECGPYYFSELKTAIKEIRTDYTGHFKLYRDKEIFIIGGAQIYRSAIEEKIVNKIIMSKIKKDYDGDTKFPILNDSEWVVSVTEHCNQFDIIHLKNKMYTTFDYA
jgi:dihydrofolate reductase